MEKINMEVKNKILLAFIITWITLSFTYTACALDRTITIDFNRPTYTNATLEEIKGLCELEALECSFEARLASKMPQGEEIIAKRSSSTNEEEIRRIATIKCEEKEMGAGCADDIVAMAWVESRFNPDAVGDNGLAIGVLQLHLGYHKHITKEQAKDIEFSIDWTLNRLKAKDYINNRNFAVRSHNGSPTNPKTLAYLQAVNNFK
jgi:hypothetical protein